MNISLNEYENDTCLAKISTTLKFFSHGPPPAIVAVAMPLITVKFVKVNSFFDS